MTLVNNVIAGRDQRIADLAYRMWEEDGRPKAAPRLIGCGLPCWLTKWFRKLRQRREPQPQKLPRRNSFSRYSPGNLASMLIRMAAIFLMCVPLPLNDK